MPTDTVLCRNVMELVTSDPSLVRARAVANLQTMARPRAAQSQQSQRSVVVRDHPVYGTASARRIGRASPTAWAQRRGAAWRRGRMLARGPRASSRAAAGAAPESAAAAHSLDSDVIVAHLRGGTPWSRIAVVVIKVVTMGLTGLTI